MVENETTAAGEGEQATRSAPEDSPRTRQVAGRAPRVQAWLLLLVAACWVAIGVVDFIGADTLSGRLTGAALLVLALTSIWCAIGIWTRGQQERALLKLAAGNAITVAVGVILLIFVASNFTPQRRLVFLAVVLFAVTLLPATFLVLDLFYLRRQGNGILRRGTGWKGNAAAIGAVATVVAALIALPQSWYSTQYLSAQATPVLSIDSGMRGVRPHPQGLAVTLEIKLTNTGRAPVRVLASLYELSGAQVQSALPPSAAEGRLDDNRLDTAMGENYGPAARYGGFAAYKQAELIQFGQIVEDQAWLEPSEYTRATVVAFLPRNRFDMLRLTAEVTFVRQDRIDVGELHAVDTDEWSAEERRRQGCENYRIRLTRWPVIYGSLLQRLTESRREVVTGLVSEAPASEDDAIWWPRLPELQASIQHVGKPCSHLLEDGDDQGLENRSMLSKAGGVTEMMIDR